MAGTFRSFGSADANGRVPYPSSCKGLEFIGQLICCNESAKQHSFGDHPVRRSIPMNGSVVGNRRLSYAESLPCGAHFCDSGSRAASHLSQSQSNTTPVKSKPSDSGRNSNLSLQDHAPGPDTVQLFADLYYMGETNLPEYPHMARRSP